MSRSLDRSLPYWLADRTDVPIEEVIWAAEEYAHDYRWADLEPVWQCWCGSTDRAHSHQGPPPWDLLLLPLRNVAGLLRRLDDPLALAVLVLWVGTCLCLGLAAWVLLW